MQINFTKYETPAPVVVMHLAGKLDASNYTDVILKAQEAYDEGMRNILIDLSKVPYVSSAGLMSLHTIVLVFSGQNAQARDGARVSFRPINMARDGEVRKRVKLFSPQPEVEQVLDTVGLKHFFEIHTDMDAAIQSF